MSLGRSNKSAWANDKNSEIIRSLEKVAREKGWVEVKPITKSASSELNLSPSSNLTENVLKLCAGLKQAGLERYALDIENKFVTFKQAATLYDAHGETGDDLINAAHPKGSHKLEDMDSSHTVLTILDQHLKGVELANKKPTGKLSNAKDILRAVKIVLADVVPASQPTTDTLNEELKTKCQQIIASIRTINTIASRELTVSISSFIDNIISAANKPTIGNLKSIKTNLATLTRRLSPTGAFHYITLGTGGLSAEGWSKVKRLFESAGKITDDALILRERINDMEGAALEKETMSSTMPTVAPVAPVVDAEFEKIKKAKMDLAGISGLVKADSDADPKDKAGIEAWIAKKDSALKKLESNYKSRSPEDIQAILNKITKGFDVARQRWS